MPDQSRNPNPCFLAPPLDTFSDLLTVVFGLPSREETQPTVQLRSGCACLHTDYLSGTRKFKSRFFALPLRQRKRKDRNELWLGMANFGWCATGHHAGCRVEFENWAVKGEMTKCECECHGNREAAEEHDRGADLPAGGAGRKKKNSGPTDAGPASTKDEQS